MAGIDAVDRSLDPDLVLHEPRQQRTRAQWERILEVGVAVLEEGGYEAFTIAALCDRAGVPPRALYARAATKDALFLAVYEHGMARVTADHAALADADTWAGEADERIDRAVRVVVDIFVAHEAFLRSVVLISGAHPEVRRRGEVHSAALAALFVAAVGGADDIAEAERERSFCFSLVFSALALRTAYGSAFGPGGDIEQLATDLVEMARRYLDRDAVSPAVRRA